MAISERPVVASVVSERANGSTNGVDDSRRRPKGATAMTITPTPIVDGVRAARAEVQPSAEALVDRILSGDPESLVEGRPNYTVVVLTQRY
jgi:hypothetical protein